ncbi:hypothetical protein M2281_003708 [Mesorhizobium soli]|uniref:hypothetical protein n=1 Tax=Pseudaminobacter soli (ex Li et al. 2025) TaxID=1295366 RepID=UPI002473FCAC|nr:hypothetical protein [Mesorhizobium soli]MDH6233097.1 hypothetical protein [Mesorhizobium soli]
MLAVENGPPPSLIAAPRRTGRIPRAGRVTGCPIGSSTLLVIGTGGPLPNAARTTLNDDPAEISSATIISWRLGTPLPTATHGFAALLPTNSAVSAFATAQFEQEGAPKRYVFTPRTVSVNEAAVLLAELCGNQLAATIDGLADLLIAAPSDPDRLSAMVALVKAAHGSNGFIELLGEGQDGEIFLQGWAHDVMPGMAQAVVDGDRPSVADSAIAVYARQDVPQGASAFAGLLDLDGPFSPGSIDGLVWRGRRGWRHVAVHERKLIAGPLETPGHVRSVLLRANSTPQTLLRLRTAANSFDGTETVSSLPLPVRMGVDNVFQVDSTGFLVSGWLLDPDSHVQSVKLRRHNGEERLDGGWSRLDRTDVTDAFADHPAFPRAFGHGSHRHGFVAHARLPDGDPSSALYLELTLRDTRRAFMPLSPLRATARLAAVRQMHAIDPSDWALPELIDRQIVPLLCTSERVSPTVDTVVDPGPFEAADGPPIVISVGENDEDGIAPLLALLAIDPETKRAPIALVVPSERFHRQVARIGKLAAFYGLSLRLVSAGEAGDAYDLLEAGARALSSDTVVLLSASLVPHKAGWYRKLVATQASLENSIVSPTLAYEDYSVRWAGTWPARRYEGYPISAVTGLKLTSVTAASLECCVLPREALVEAGGFAGGYLGSREKGLDLGLRLSRDGVASYWLPSVQMLGSDQTSSTATSAMGALVESIDRKILDARGMAELAGKGNPSEGPRT